MKTKLLINLIMTGLLTVSMAAPVYAESEAETRNLFKAAGQKQTAKDFKPAPDKIKTNFGTLKFEGGAFPDEASTQRIYDELDLQRATQAYMDFLPSLSLYGIVKSQVRDFKFKSSSDFAVMADFMKPSENYLTGNDVTVYAFATLDLKVDGATVMEIPAGMYGNANDAVFKYLTDFGPTGPDKGKGGKYLFLPPGYKGKVPQGYFVIHSAGYRIWAMMRGFGEVGNGDQAVNWFKERLKVYPLESGPRDTTVVNGSGMGANTLFPEDASAFTMLNEIIQYEPAELFSAEQLGRLASLGLEKGKPFNPDARMTGILDQAAKQGVAMSRAIVYASRDKEINYWSNRHWEKMFVRNTEFVNNGHSDIDARTLWHYQAICVSPNLLSTTAGVGTAYLTSFRDKEGDYLLGDNTYRLTVPANPPVKRFWAVTAYDPMSRSLLDSGGNITVSSTRGVDTNPDGSVDIYFGQKAPKGMEKNFIKTDPKKGFFVVFRFYGPLKGYIEKTWTLNDFELMK
ncbi:DUF1254 domain-containing protein [Desulfobacula sp.]|uniref:DUF1254 domain-containing protein n=1 Tax=Desulfobacula sp. TaxID=2593537 RepID=UPI00260D2009|nr:DUF1254 domain-containing protein [Desulfobacula sp.]